MAGRRLAANHLRLIDICKLKDSGEPTTWKLLPVPTPPGPDSMAAFVALGAAMAVAVWVGRADPEAQQRPSAPTRPN